jgi:hypothetical protein
MRELGQNTTIDRAELHGILQRLEAALGDVDQLQLMVIGAQLSQVIEEIRAMIDA